MKGRIRRRLFVLCRIARSSPAAWSVVSGAGCASLGGALPDGPPPVETVRRRKSARALAVFSLLLLLALPVAARIEPTTAASRMLVYLVYADVPWRTDMILWRRIMAPDHVAQMALGEDPPLEIVVCYHEGERLVGGAGRRVERLVLRL